MLFQERTSLTIAAAGGAEAEVAAGRLTGEEEDGGEDTTEQIIPRKPRKNVKREEPEARGQWSKELKSRFSSQGIQERKTCKRMSSDSAYWLTIPCST